jgi:hypothetical protein
MATKVYDTEILTLIDGTEIELKPLKIKYLREFMEVFSLLPNARNDDEAMIVLVECAVISMKQFCPDIATMYDIEDRLDLKMVYKVLDYAAGIKINADKQDETVKEQAEKSDSSTWETLDLLKIESEVFMMGTWKNYEDLEESMSMPELIATISAKRELDYQEKKFFAAIQGVDLDDNKQKGEDAWEAMKARVFSRGASSDPNDVLSLQGANAAKAGFGIGMGLTYEKI